MKMKSRCLPRATKKWVGEIGYNFYAYAGRQDCSLAIFVQQYKNLSEK